MHPNVRPLRRRRGRSPRQALRQLPTAAGTRFTAAVLGVALWVLTIAIARHSHYMASIGLSALGATAIIFAVYNRAMVQWWRTAVPDTPRGRTSEYVGATSSYLITGALGIWLFPGTRSFMLAGAALEVVAGLLLFAYTGPRYHYSRYRLASNGRQFLLGGIPAVLALEFLNASWWWYLNIAALSLLVGWLTWTRRPSRP